MSKEIMDHRIYTTNDTTFKYPNLFGNFSQISSALSSCLTNDSGSTVMNDLFQQKPENITRHV